MRKFSANLRHTWLPLLITTLACNALTGSPATTVPATNLPQPPAVSSPTSEPSASPAPSTPVPQPPLASLDENLSARIAAGEWSLETGLVTTLKLFVGEASLQDVNPAGRTLLSNEVSGVLSLAAAYVEAGQDSATQTELQRLLDMIVPDPAKLRELAQPMQSSTPARVVKLSNAQACSTLWRAGWPAGSGALCFEYQRETINGRDYEVFFPLDWGTEESRAEYAALTFEAVRDSVATYTPLGDMPPAYIVYTWDQDYSSTESAGLAMAALFSNPCRIAVFPFGANVLSANGAEVFKQLLAHELFHCFQNRNLVYHPGTYTANAWWVEGTAEYFSNVVYPDVNVEHRFAADFDARSVGQSLFEMTYQNYIFFQFLGNTISDGATISLLRDLPREAGLPAQQAFLSAYPGLGSLFKDYAQAYLNGAIMDTNGLPVPVSPNLDEEEEFESTDGSYEHPFEARSFVIRRVVLSFPERTRHALGEDGSDELTSSARLTAPGAWFNLPSNVNAACQPRRLVYLLTGTTADDSAYSKTIRTTVTRLPESARCDDCLVGEWLADNDSQWNAFLALYSATGGLYTPTLQGISGQVRVTFFEEGIADVFADNFQIQYTQVVPGSGRIDATTTNNSSLITDWYTDGAGGLFVTEIYAQPDITSDAVVTAAGISLPIEIDMPDVTLLGSGSYVCTDDTLELSSYPGIFVTHTRISPP